MSEDNNHSKNLGSTNSQPNPIPNASAEKPRSSWRPWAGSALLALPMLLLVPMLTDTCRHCALDRTTAAIALFKDQFGSHGSATDQTAGAEPSADRHRDGHTLAKAAPGSCETLAFAVVEAGAGSSAYCTIAGGDRCGDLDEITASKGHFSPSPEFQGMCKFDPQTSNFPRSY